MPLARLKLKQNKFTMNTLKETKPKEKTCCGPECCSDNETDTAVLETDLTKEKSEEELKQIVKDQYSEIALQTKEQN